MSKYKYSQSTMHEARAIRKAYAILLPQYRTGLCVEMISGAMGYKQHRKGAVYHIVHNDTLPDDSYTMPRAKQYRKICGACGKERDRSRFSADNKNSDGFNTDCIYCTGECIAPGRVPAPKYKVISFDDRNGPACPVCGMQIHTNWNRRSTYGKAFQSQHEADQCCAGTEPIYRHSVLQTRGRFMMFNDRI